MKRIQLLIFSLFVTLNIFYTQSVDENLVKALFIKKIIPYVEWPDEVDNDTFKIAFLGKTDLEKYVKELFRKDVDFKSKVQFIHISESEVHRPYHILIVSSHYKKHTKGVHPNTLSILGKDSSFGKNIILRFLKVDDRVRFKISTDALRFSKINLSSRLLKLALKESFEEE